MPPLNQEGDGPPLYRPIPRRPFQLSLTKVTPPDATIPSPSPQSSNDCSSNTASDSIRPVLSSDPSSVSPSSEGLNLEVINKRLLDPSFSPSSRRTAANTPPPDTSSASTSLTRAQSVLNLANGSTLFGIYSQAEAFASPPLSGRFPPSGSYYEGDADVDSEGPNTPATPWGTGARNAPRRIIPASAIAGGGDETAAITTITTREKLTPARRALHLLLLFGLGMLYGGLVARFQSQSTHDHTQDGRSRGAEDGNHVGAGISNEWNLLLGGWKYMVFWGGTGVVLGGLLPWFDGLWEAVLGEGTERGSIGQSGERGEKATSSTSRGRSRLRVGSRSDARLSSADENAMSASTSGARTGSGTDWALVIRGVGAFVGIIYAIRKLHWSSTLQLSLTLSLINPALWFLIDRSKPGLLLSLIVGLAGSALLVRLQPDLVPAPTAIAGFSSSLSFANPSVSSPRISAVSANLSSFWDTANSTAEGLAAGDGGASKKDANLSDSSRNLLAWVFLKWAGAGRGAGEDSAALLDVAVWTFGVLFCCCLCFGNIGRRLALGTSASGKGRWAERK